MKVPKFAIGTARIANGTRNDRQAPRIGTTYASTFHSYQWRVLVVLFASFTPWTSCDTTFDPNCSVTVNHRGAADRFATAAAIVPHGTDESLQHPKNRTARRTRSAMVPTSSNPSSPSLRQILVKAAKRAMGGGFSGAVAGMVQVITLMWLRTVTNYQYRYGTTFQQAFQTLWKEGGIPRLYRGLPYALIQAPMAKFASVAANDGVLSLFGGNGNDTSTAWGAAMTTIASSIIYGLVRIILMPIDTMKTILQVDSTHGLEQVMRSLRQGKFMVLYQGAGAVAVMGVAAYYPWFYTYNMMVDATWIQRTIPSMLLRNAFIGFVASIASDTTSNVFRVIKTVKQVSGSKGGGRDSSYADIIRRVIATDGWKGLFGRGLGTRLGTNAIQSILFTVVWGVLEERSKRASEKNTQ